MHTVQPSVPESHRFMRAAGEVLQLADSLPFHVCRMLRKNTAGGESHPALKINFYLFYKGFRVSDKNRNTLRNTLMLHMLSLFPHPDKSLFLLLKGRNIIHIILSETSQDLWRITIQSLHRFS